MTYLHQRQGHVPSAMTGIVWSAFGTKDVHLANPDIPAERQLIDMVVGLCETKHIAVVPPVYIAKTGVVNAASVSGQGLVYTTAILRQMNPQQLAAITGHELSHHRHASRDMLTILGISVAASIAASYGFRALSSTALSSGNQAVQAAGRAMEGTTFQIFSQYLAIMAAVTPWRHFMELEADREGAAATSPGQMKSALERLDEIAHKPSSSVSQRSWMNRVVRAVLNPFPSHPATDSRIERMAQLEQPSRSV